MTEAERVKGRAALHDPFASNDGNTNQFLLLQNGTQDAQRLLKLRVDNNLVSFVLLANCLQQVDGAHYFGRLMAGTARHVATPLCNLFPKFRFHNNNGIAVHMQ